MELQTYQTSYGEFSRYSPHDVWQLDIEIRNMDVGILADDVNGRPDPDLLKLIPYIVENLSALEDKARQAVPDLRPQHLFSLIAQTDTDSDFQLGFSYDEDDWGESYFADFKDGEVVCWSSAG